MRTWAKAQAGPAEKLLLSGVRYFDLRVGVDDKPDLGSGRFKLCHGVFGPSVEEYLSDVKSFLDSNTSEVVILHIQKVTSFGKVTLPVHEELMQVVVSCLGGKDRFVKEAEMTKSLAELTESGRQVYFVYQPAENVWSTVRDFMLPATMIRSHWPNTSAPRECLKNMEDECKVQCRANKDKIFVFQAVLTPNVSDIVFGICCGLCMCVDRNLFDFSRRMAPRLQDRLPTFNENDLRNGAVIMLDFVSDESSKDLVDQIIGMNNQLQKPKASE